MLQIILVLVFSAHLLLIDIAMAGPLVCVWLEWRATRCADPLADRAAMTLARLSIWALAGGILIGGLLLAARWWRNDDAYFTALSVIPVSRMWNGLAELLFSFVCMAAYVALWDRWRKRPVLHWLLAIAASSNLLVHFPALFAIVSVLSTRGQQLGQVLDGAGYRLLLVDGEVLSRVAHVWLAAFAVTGITLMAIGQRLGGEPQTSAAGQRLIQHAAWLGLVPSLLQIPSGLWLAWQMPESAREPLLGGDWVATGLFFVSMLLAFFLMHTLAAIALGDHEPKQIRRSIATLLILVPLMVGTRVRLDSDASAERGDTPISSRAPSGTSGSIALYSSLLFSLQRGPGVASTWR